VHLVFDIFQGIGIAAAAGVRPFLPGLAAGALAAGDIQIDFKGTDYSFLQHAPFLLALAVGAILLVLAERRFAPERFERGAGGAVLAVIGAGVGAVFFAGSLCRGHHVIWPGIVGGIVCAGVGVAATRPLLRRARVRLQGGAAATLSLYAEGAALLLGALSIIAPPVGLIGLGLLLWLLFAGRGRDEEKYAGLRILR
jgi:protein-S-isoprenylcysteine O-methyltransferase Ste14